MSHNYLKTSWIFVIALTITGPMGQKLIVAAAPTSSLGHILSLPRNAEGALPLLIILPGKNVPASSEQNNWKFSASKNRFAMVVLDVDYSIIQSDDDLKKVHDRIKTTVNSLEVPGVTFDQKRIYLAGTSRGGMMAIALALRYPTDYVATSVVCGSYLTFGAKQFLANATGRRFYLAHGSDDKVVSIQSFEETKVALETHGAVVTSKIIPGGGHIISGAYNEAVNWLTTAQHQIKHESKSNE